MLAFTQYTILCLPGLFLMTLARASRDISACCSLCFCCVGRFLVSIFCELSWVRECKYWGKRNTWMGIRIILKLQLFTTHFTNIRNKTGTKDIIENISQALCGYIWWDNKSVWWRTNGTFQCNCIVETKLVGIICNNLISSWGTFFGTPCMKRLFWDLRKVRLKTHLCLWS